MTKGDFTLDGLSNKGAKHAGSGRSLQIQGEHEQRPLDKEMFGVP